MTAPTTDVWEVLSTARTIRRFTDGLGACMTSWASYGGEPVLREAVGVPDGWLLAGHVVVGWPKGRHGPVRRRPLADAVNLDHWDQPPGELLTD